MRNRLYIFGLLFVFLMIFVSCEEKPDPKPAKDAPRTILVYMIASNSLGSYGYDIEDINEMKKAVATGNINDCRILVYHVKYNSYPKLLEIKRGGDGKAVESVLKIYENDEKSTTKERMGEVFNDMKTYAPAKDYGLVLWSHSSGWAESLPRSYNRSYKFLSNGEFYLTRQYGDDKGSQMPIDELANAIPSNTFSFIYTDACYMGSLEIAYQVKEKTRYYIGSAALLPAAGMPYDKNIPVFCQTELDLKQACKNTYDYYDKLSGVSRTITISLVDCKELDNLSLICKDIYATAKGLEDISVVQKYIAPYDGQCIYFDFAQYTKLISSGQEQIKAFESQLEKTVIYKASTPRIFEKLTIDPNKFSGVSSYILNSGDESCENYYRKLDWYQSVYPQ